MKKTTLAIIFTMMLVLAAAITVSATTEFPVGDDGKYSINYQLSEAGIESATDGDMYGMLVIEATESVETLVVDEDDIRYIDQGEANGGYLAFDAFIPMDLNDKEAGQYLVFIGGEGLEKATQIGVLKTTTSTEPEEPVDPPVVDPTVIDGDVDYNNVYNTDDVLYFVNHLALGDFGLYPVTYPKSLDFDSSGVVDTADVLYLVNNLALGDFGMYPLYPQN